MALWHYLFLNMPAPNKHLFTNTFKSNRCPLTCTIFLYYIVQATACASLPSLHSYSLHIEGTLEFFLWGLLFNAIQVKGHWVSDTFHTYLYYHAEIMMVHIQSNTAIHHVFV